VIVPHTELKPGDVIAYHRLHWEGEQPNPPVLLTVVRAGESCEDRFGRPMTRCWCRGKVDEQGNPSDVEREGVVTYGPGAEVDRVMTAWRPANNGAGKRIWFLYRDAPKVGDRYHLNSNGQLVRYASMQGAQRAADLLNERAKVVAE
jgi:hypothetical protein